jgi:Na+/proline symporter
MSGLHAADIVVLVVCLTGITALGISAGRGAKNIAEFFMPRRFGKITMIMNAFGSGTASDQAVSVAAATFQSGLSGIWYQWLWLFVTPFYWLIAPIMRRLRAVTTADAYRLRFDNSVAVLFALVGMASMSVKIGLMLKGGGALIEAATGTAFDADWAIAVITVLFVVYGIAGGLAAAIVTETVTGLLILTFSFMLLPFVLRAVGGMQGIRETVTQPGMLSLVAPEGITVFFVVMMSLQALVGIVAQPHIMGVCGAGKTEFEGRVGIMFGNLVKRICTIAWCLTSIAALAWYMQRGASISTIKPDSIYGDMAKAFLPQAAPGLLGLFLAATLAGVMGACNSFMIASAALFTQNIYRPCQPDESQKHYLWVGRMSSLVVVAAGVLFAYWVPNVVRALEIWFMVAPMMGIVFWIGLFWRRMTVVGAWASTSCGFAAWYVSSQSWFVSEIERLNLPNTWNVLTQKAGVPMVSLPWQILFYLTIATIAGVVVSLLTRPVDAERLNRFYDLIRTPIVPGEKITAVCTLPQGVEPATRPLLIDFAGLQVPRPSLVSLVGFAGGWLAVALLILSFVLIVQM